MITVNLNINTQGFKGFIFDHFFIPNNFFNLFVPNKFFILFLVPQVIKKITFKKVLFKQI